MSVRRIVGWSHTGETPEEIVQQIPHLTLAQVHAALAYYHANKDEMDAAIAAEEAEYDLLEELHRQSGSEG